MYTIEKGVFYNYETNTSTLTIPATVNGETVTEIGMIGNYLTKRKLKKVIIPNTVKVIRNNAFWNCSNLAKVIIQNNSELTTIMESAFQECIHLQTFPFDKTPNLVEIGGAAFRKTGLTTANLSKTKITKIERNCFKESALKQVFFPEKLKVIEEYAFEGSRLINVDFSNIKECCEISHLAFSDTPISIIKFPINQHIEITGNDVFALCDKLREVVIPPTVEITGEGCFEACHSLETVHFLKCDGAKPKPLAKRSFLGCCKLDTVRIDFPFDEISSAAFAKCKNLEKIYFPTSLNTISNKAFFECPSLKEIDLSKCNIEYIDENAFNLTSFNLDSFKMDFFSEANISKTSFDGNKNIDIKDFLRSYPFCHIV